LRPYINYISFIFSSDGENAGYYGSMIIEKNRFRLPKSTIPFKDGDTIRFAMGGLNDTDFSVAAAFANPATPAGVLKSTGTVRFRETETNHIQFEILVNKDMSEWFNPNIGFTNFDSSQFINFDTMSALNHLTAVGSMVTLISMKYQLEPYQQWMTTMRPLLIRAVLMCLVLVSL